MIRPEAGTRNEVTHITLT